MMDQFLSALLQIVILLDVVGLLAYFVLGALKRRRESVPAPASVAAVARPGWWQRVRQRLSFPPGSQEDLEASLHNLRRVLHSYKQGLA
ncbi:MAG: hypothetical protein FJY95_21755 [Candidatus Handelsmanbacteria bacterium]|nr:hypothetical protein [Candidatus Handelsmanbacteria bacterium]